MKKMMFNDKYGLTKAVLELLKSMTRRIADSAGDIDNMEFKRFQDGKAVFASATGVARIEPKYKVGEVVAVAQAYQELLYNIGTAEGAKKFNTLSKTSGWSNKMFVKADLMPHHVRITNVRVERLQDISDEDCLKEGITKPTFDTFTFDGWKYFAYNPREAYAALIDRVCRKGTWASNPWVFVYEFELVR
jgi:hypothetical protein